MKRQLSQEELALMLDIVEQNSAIVDMNWKIINGMMPDKPEDDSDERGPTCNECR